MLAAVGLLPIVAMVVLAPLMARHLAEPRFEAAVACRWVLWFKGSVTALDELGDDEKVLEVLFLTNTRLFPAFNRQVWVLTERRLLVFAVDLGGQRRISLHASDGRRFSGYAGSPVTARRPASAAGARSLGARATTCAGSRPALPVDAPGLGASGGPGCRGVRPPLASRVGGYFGRRSITRLALPTERSMVPTGLTSMWVEMPM